MTEIVERFSYSIDQQFSAQVELWRDGDAEWPIVIARGSCGNGARPVMNLSKDAALRLGAALIRAASPLPDTGKNCLGELL